MLKITLRKTVSVMVLGLVLGGSPAISSATLTNLVTNGGFETGDFTGWTVPYAGGLASVVSSYESPSSLFLPKEGSYFAQLNAGVDVNVYTTISQTFNMAAGSTISGWAAFQANDYIPFNDDAYVKIGSSTLWQSSVSAVGNYGHTNWEYWSWSAPLPGTYTIEAGVRNFLDNSVSSSALFDGIKTQAVPAPATMLLLGYGLIGLVCFGRKKLF
jgi:hypothetical protein